MFDYIFDFLNIQEFKGLRVQKIKNQDVCILFFSYLPLIFAEGLIGFTV